MAATLWKKLLADLAATGVTIVSGLALGIDAIAHKASLKNKLPTVGVLVHGLDKIYPAVHTVLQLKDILRQVGRFAHRIQEQ